MNTSRYLLFIIFQYELNCVFDTGYAFIKVILTKQDVCILVAQPFLSQLNFKNTQFLFLFGFFDFVNFYLLPLLLTKYVPTAYYSKHLINFSMLKRQKCFLVVHLKIFHTNKQ